MYDRKASIFVGLENIIPLYGEKYLLVPSLHDR